MFKTVRHLTLIAVAAILIPTGFAEAGEKLETEAGMSGDMMLFLMDSGIDDRDIDLLLKMEASDEEIMDMLGFTEVEWTYIYLNGLSGMDLGSGRIQKLSGTDLGSGRIVK